MTARVKMQRVYKLIDLFAGVRGVRIGFQNAFKKEGEFVFSSEIDEKAKETYALNHKEIPIGDITKVHVSKIPKHDIVLAAFPCQAFSVAGKRMGFEDTRGTLFFEVARIIKHHEPEVVFLENVKNLHTHDKGNTFRVIKETLNKLGYKVFYNVLNAKDYDLPQNRERIFIVGFKNHDAEFKFPSPKKAIKTIHSCILDSTRVDEKYYYDDKPLYEKIKDDVKCQDTIYQWRRKYVRANKSGVCPTLTANMGTGGHNVPIIKDDKGIRKLTPRECANFQGFPKAFKTPQGMADSHLYKQFGNSVPIALVEEIAKEIKITLDIFKNRDFWHFSSDDKGVEPASEEKTKRNF